MRHGDASVQAEHMAHGFDAIARMDLCDDADLVRTTVRVFVEKVATYILKLLPTGLQLPIRKRR